MRLPFRRRRPRPMHPELRKVPDDLPRDGLFAQPLRVVSLKPTVERRNDGQVRVTFAATVKDAEGKRCPDLAVEATVTGPERTATGMAHTDLMGMVRFRMTGPAGRYSIAVDDVAGGALALDADGSRLTADIDAP